MDETSHDETSHDETSHPKRDIESLIIDFMVPRNIIDVVFILICIVVAWYAVSYNIPEAMQPVVCYKYWIETICPCAFSPFSALNNSSVPSVILPSLLMS
jgi:hypothetical protein